MPYIKRERRGPAHLDHDSQDVGELTYALTAEVLEYITRKGERFSTYADALAALEATKLELYRRKIAPYEDQKRRENGEVYFGRLDPDVKAP